MSHLPPASLRAPKVAGWDIAFTRLALGVFNSLGQTTEQLRFLLELAGVRLELSDKLSDIGLYRSLEVHGDRGLICSVGFQVIDGMFECGTPGAALDVNLLDNQGDIVLFLSSMRNVGAAGLRSDVEGIVAMAGKGTHSQSLYQQIVEHFCLAQERGLRR